MVTAIEPEIDLDLDDDQEINESEVVFEDYENCEIELDDIDWESTDSLISDEIQLTFIPDDSAVVVDSHHPQSINTGLIS